MQVFWKPLTHDEINVTIAQTRQFASRGFSNDAMLLFSISSQKNLSALHRDGETGVQ